MSARRSTRLRLCVALVLVASVAVADDGEKLYRKNCLACHGQGGASVVSTHPVLAGQRFDYLRGELSKLRSGKRISPVMSPMAAGLPDDAAVEAVAKYLSQQPRPAGSKTDTAPTVAQLYLEGDPERGLKSCASCHGDDGISTSSKVYPHLAGQHADYVAAAMYAYASGARKSRRMNNYAKKLAAEEIEQLAAYISGLPD